MYFACHMQHKTHQTYDTAMAVQLIEIANVCIE